MSFFDRDPEIPPEQWPYGCPVLATIKEHGLLGTARNPITRSPKLVPFLLHVTALFFIFEWYPLWWSYAAWMWPDWA